MKLKTLSRGTDIDTNLCVSNIGNRYDLVIVAAARARELARRHRVNEFGDQLNAPVTALLEIQNGKVGREYMKRVR
jgi:DNA-directed RNA polymerase omega subunit